MSIMASTSRAINYSFVLQANLYPRILAAMKPGATLGLSHGFLLGVLKNDGVDFRDDINVILVAPKVTNSVVYGLMLSGLLQQDFCNDTRVAIGIFMLIPNDVWTGYVSITRLTNSVIVVDNHCIDIAFITSSIT